MRVTQVCDKLQFLTLAFHSYSYDTHLRNSKNVY